MYLLRIYIMYLIILNASGDPFPFKHKHYTLSRKGLNISKTHIKLLLKDL